MNNEDDYLMMSGIQHFDYCKRQWALIHIEQEWKENVLTAEGRIDHKKCHDETEVEKRKDIIIMRGMRVVSHNLKLIGVCDVVEFYKNENGISLSKYDGKWLPVPVEYKHGESKAIDADRLQLCAQALALEEMLVCNIEYGYLFYKKTKRREKVIFGSDLREKVRILSKEMNDYFERGWTPSAKNRSKCKACSLSDICVPSVSGNNIKSYIDSFLEV